MTIQIPNPNKLPRWSRHAIATIALVAFVGNPAVYSCVSCMACNLAHSVKVIKKFDQRMGLRNIIQFS